MTKHTDKTNVIRLGKGRRAFILIASIFTAIAVAVACALCFDTSKPVSVGDVESSVSTSATTYSNLTGDKTAAGALNNGDIINYTYNGGVYSIKLPKGTFKFEVWGAQGGYYDTGCLGGKGGYTYISSYEVTATAGQYIYIVVGSQGGNGSSGAKAGGYNGGGSTNIGNSGGGGGGATHMALASGLLKNVSSSNVLLVGGGGGGSTTSAHSGTYGQGGYGGGGNASGGASSGGWIDGAGYQAKGGTTSAGGAGGKGATTTSCTYVIGGNGSYGQGGVSNASYEAGGGGGGGYYGGGGGGGDNNSAGADGRTGGGGGSGYIKSGYSGSGTSNSQSGNGTARITVLSVNQAPAAKTTASSTLKSNTTYYRGAQTISFTPDDIATDPDATKTTLYFTNGTASNLDTFQNANTKNQNLWINSACTTLATKYVQWTCVSNRQINITNILLYPRKGADGCATDGILILYTKVRDNFGSSTARGWSIIPIYIRVGDRALTAKTDKLLTKTYTRSDNVQYTYRYGDPTHTGTSDASKNYDYINNPNSIYNPNGSGKTVFLPKSIAPTDSAGYTIYASDLYTDADTSHDKVAFKTVASTSYTTYYTITYNSNSDYASGLVPSITIKPTGVRPSGAIYVAATITAQTSETGSKVGIGAANTAVTLVFRMSNTRPYFASTQALPSTVNLTEPLVTLAPGGVATVNLKSMVYDMDDSTLSKHTFAQTVNDVVIPTGEYIQVDMSNVRIPLKTNVGSNYAAYDNDSNKASTSYKTGQGTVQTTFKQGLIAPVGSANASTANVLYSFDNSQTIRFTARAATQYQYSDKANSTHSRKGDFYILVRVIDPSDTADTGIWFPIAIKVNSSAPTTITPSAANFTLEFTQYTDGVEDQLNPSDAKKGRDAIQNPESGIVITPISYTDANGVLRGIGTTNSSFGTNGNHASPFAVDPDGFMYPSGTTTASPILPLNDLALLYGTSDFNNINIANIVNRYDTTSFFDISVVSLYADRQVFSQLNLSDAQLAALGVKTYSDGNAGYEFKGLRIIPKRSTNDEFFQIEVKTVDTRGTQGLVTVCIKVLNRRIEARRGSYEGNNGNESTAYRINPITNVGTYTRNTNIGALAVNYTIECNDIVRLTPYDFAYDFDVDPDNSQLNPRGGALNTNPADSGFQEAANYIRKPYNIKHTSSPSALAQNTSIVYGQQLTFINTGNIIANAGQYSNYISVAMGKCKVGNTEYEIPCIEIEGLSRTTSAIVQLRFTISDGSTTINCVITVTVKNSAPTRVNNNVYQLTAGVKDGYTNSLELAVDEIAVDKDGDIPTFVTDPVHIYAKVDNAYYEALDADMNGVDIDSPQAVYKMSDYIYVSIAKNSLGLDVVYVRALSSTEFFTRQIYLAVRVKDGFRAQPEEVTLYILINVINSEPTMATDTLVVDSNGNYSWMIECEDTEKTLSRYIVNSRELCESPAIPAITANKIWLFDDADGQQEVILNPLSWIKDTNYSGALIRKTTASVITSEMFTSSTEPTLNAGVIYTKTYTSGEDQYLNIEPIFFEKSYSNGRAVFTPLPLDSEKVKTSQYWALRIIDKGTGTSDALRTQIAIAVKDDQHSATLYTADKSKEIEEHSSSLTVLNFFYGYKMPGVLALHNYYRTDGNAEAATSVVGGNEEGKFVVDKDGVRAYQFKNKAIPGTAEELRNATFIDNFKYQYYVDKLTRGTTSEATYKHYPVNEGSAFYYSPIEVGGVYGGEKAIVPISYIALPSSAKTGITEDRAHVTFANATANTSMLNKNGNKLNDNEYYSWSQDNANDRNAIFENLTLSDGIQVWTGWNQISQNPYIDIKYVSNTKFLGPQTGVNRYRNSSRFEVSVQTDSNSHSITFIDANDNSGNSNCREDKFGFEFGKKDGGERPTGYLKLTVALKTTTSAASGDDTDSAVEYVEVDINLKNTFAKIVDASGSEKDKGYVDDESVKMTTRDSVGKTVILNDYKNGVDNAKGDVKLFFSDPDVTDTVKFYIPSATGTMNRDEIDHVANNFNFRQSENGVIQYFNGTQDADKYTYKPNPDFDKFFTVSPATGSASILQFIPVAKTQVNIPSGATRTQYLTDHNLKEDAGGVYYPFRILVYDDISGSSFLDGSWYTYIIKVYIANDDITVVDSITDKYTSTNPTYNNKPNYKFKLSKNVDFFVDVSSLLVDNDIVTSGMSFAVKTDTAWTSLEKEQQYIHDYFVMPAASAGVVLKNPNSSGASPVTVSAPDAGSEMPKTALVFRASSAFVGSYDIAYTFEDSVREMGGGTGSSVMIVFTVEYNNESPTAHSDTFDGGSALSVVMKHGDYFTVYAADSTLFAGDAIGGFTSVKTLRDVKFPTGAAVAQTAKEMRNSFQFKDEMTYGSQAAVGNLGSLIVGNDDAPSTLRFAKYTLTNSNTSLLDITEGTRYAKEGSTAQLPMSYTIKANAVGSTTMALEIEDGSGAKTTVNINIIVVSTPPASKESAISGLTRVDAEQSIYSMSIAYGESKSLSFVGFMNDIDDGDNEGLDVNVNADGTDYTITNPEGVSAITARTESTQFGGKSVVITAIDFIPMANEYATVSFRVKDAHNAVSNLVTIRVYVTPSEVQSVATQNNVYNVTLKSYDQYESDGTPVTVNIVDLPATAHVFSDIAVAAPSAQYDVKLYALLAKNEDGTFSNVRENNAAFNPSEALIISIVNGVVSSGKENRKEIALYVARYFDVTVSEDGKQFEFIPKSATIATSGTDLAAIQFKVEVAKHYSNGTGSTTQTPKSAYMSVAVANSQLTVVKNSPYNYGYPMVGEGNNARLRESAFLEFNGTAGDSLTWDLFSTVDYELGLFYDYDMINNPKADGGLETVNHVNTVIRMEGATETVTGQGPVLSVSVSNDGKLTIKINRKVCGSQPSLGSSWKPSTDMYVDVYCADTIGYRSNPRTTRMTTIKVSVENDVPDFKTITDRHETEELGYSITYSDIDGYVLSASIARGKSLYVNVEDIIDDADIKMDAYFLLYTDTSDSLMGSDGYLTGSITSDGNNDGIGRIKSNDELLFTVRQTQGKNDFGISRMQSLVFTCESVARGEVGTCTLKFRDSVQDAVTRILTINLTVANIAPEIKKNANLNITVMGKNVKATDDDLVLASRSFSILDFITDQNGDDYDAALTQDDSRRPTYVYIEGILLYSYDDPINAPTIYGPGVFTEEIDEVTGETITSREANSACRVSWDSTDMYHQRFTVEPLRGVYGVQKVTFTIIDSGYEDGASAGVLDGEAFDKLTITITIANPLEDVPNELDEQSIAYGITRDITVTDLLGEENAYGYVIESLQEIDTNYLQIYSPGEQAGVHTSAVATVASEEWRIYAKSEGATSRLRVVFKAGEVTSDPRILPVKVVTNPPPKLKNGKKSYEYTVDRLNDRNNRMLRVYPEDWFDDNLGDIMEFVGPIESSQTVKVEALLDFDDMSEGGRAFIMLTFNRRGAADISFYVRDLSGRLYEHTITVNCTDAPEMSWWENLISLIEANWLWFWIIVGATLLLIIFLIILIVVIHKKRKIRREIEALLNSETELEEEMMRLNASAQAAQYQALGFLAAAHQAATNPNLMLGGGATNPTPNSLQLAAGTGSTIGTDQAAPPPQQQPMQQPMQQQPMQQQPMQQPMQQQQPMYQQPPMGNGGMPYNPAQGPMQGQPMPGMPQQGGTMTPPPPAGDGFDPNDF
ncbi:MAG: hypothetical protein J1G01_04075 [Clostridiales bacterium]|nr:hypothetical protein [Clostridiales bacterium]